MRSIGVAAWVAASCCVIVACAACKTVRSLTPSKCEPLVPPPPAPVAAPEPLPTPASQITIPVTLELAALLKSADEEAAHAGATAGWNGDPDSPTGWSTVGDNRYRYQWDRDPLRIRLIGDELQIHADIRYRIQGQTFVKAPKVVRFLMPLIALDKGHWVGSHCGGDRKPTLKASADLHITYQLRPDWTIDAVAGLDDVNAIDQCEIKILKITVENATKRVREELGRILLAKIEGLADRIRKKDIRTPMNAAWVAFQTPKAVVPGAWVVPMPDTVTMTAPVGSGTSLMFVVDVAARFPIQLSEAVPADPPSPLPDLTDAGSLRGFRVTVQGDLPYAAIQRELDKLVGKEYAVKSRRMRLLQTKVTPAGTGRVAIEVLFESTGNDLLCGTLYLVGTPSYDPIRDVLSFPDLEFDVRTSDILVNAYAWIKESDLVKDLRAAARWQALPMLAGLTDKLNTAFAADQRLAVSITQLELGGVSAGDDSLTVRIVASGAARFQGAITP